MSPDPRLAPSIFLLRLKPLLEAGRVVIQPRNPRKTWEFMINMGLDTGDMFGILARLRPEHYHAGPEDDRDGSVGNVMVFFYPYEGLNLYLKLKIWDDEAGDHAAVLSFHEEGKHDN
jgi:hypothetical protein